MIGAPVQHDMKLRHGPFERIRNGTKTVEMRLLDEKRSRIKVGDRIRFLDIDNGQVMECEVTDLFMYRSFKDLYACHDKISLGYEASEPAVPEDMLSYYSEDDMNRYGVIGIGVRTVGKGTDGK